MAMNNRKSRGIAKGFAASKLLRQKINQAIYEVQVVVNKIELSYNKETKEYEISKEVKGLAVYNPVFERFGLRRDYKEMNVTVDVEDDNGNVTKRKVNIDGKNIILCESIMFIKCDNLKQIDRMDKDGYVYNGELYRVLGASPSQQKHATKAYFKVTNEFPTEKSAFLAMDAVSGFVFTRGIFRNKVDGTKVISANTRFGNYLTGMKCLCKIDLSKDYIVIVDGSIPGADDFELTEAEKATMGSTFNPETKSEMQSKGLEFDNNINDGALHFGVPTIQEIGLNVGVSLSEEDALRVALQSRITFITAKIMGDCMVEDQLLTMASLPNARKYGNTNGRLMLVVDTDGAKALNVPDLENGTAVLDVFVMAMAAVSEPKSSGQHLIKYMNVAPERTLSFINTITTENLEAYVMNQVSEGKGSTVVDEIRRSLGEEAFATKILVEGMYKDAFTFIQSAIAKTKLSIEAVYSHMTFDSTFVLTKGLLRGILDITSNGFVQAYCPDVCKKYAKEIKDIEDRLAAGKITEEEAEAELFALLSGTVIKYPSAGTKEFEIIVYQTMAQIRKSIETKVAALGLDNKDADAMVNMLLAYFQNRPYGTTTFAPLNSMKNKLAGADCDFDATMTDMSELKWILIEQRLEEQKANPGFMGNCTYISYKDVPRNNVVKSVVEDTLGNTDDIEW